MALLYCNLIKHLSFTVFDIQKSYWLQVNQAQISAIGVNLFKEDSIEIEKKSTS